MKKLTAAILAGILLTLALSACAASAPSASSASSKTATAPAPAAPPSAAREFGGITEEYAVAQDMASPEYEMTNEAVNPSTAGGIDAAAGSGAIFTESRKIITTVNLHMETKEFDTGVDKVTALVEEFGGFVQSSYVEGKSLYNERGSRSANYTLRIPSEKVSDLISMFAQEFNITSTNQHGDDVTDHYYDTEARLNSLRIQERQLLEMLETAGELKYLLEVQRELANVRYEIESLTASLQRMDSYVSMSTMNVYLQEVVQYEQLIDEPATFGEELRNAVWDSAKQFADFCRNIVLTLVLAFPYLLILAVLAFVLLWLRRQRKKRNKAGWNIQNSPHAPPEPEKKETRAPPPEHEGGENGPGGGEA